MERSSNSIRPLLPDFENEVFEDLNGTSYERYVEWKKKI
jgi:hypothetical protein